VTTADVEVLINPRPVSEFVTTADGARRSVTHLGTLEIMGAQSRLQKLAIVHRRIARHWN
jgi:hypothetical protein